MGTDNGVFKSSRPTGIPANVLVVCKTAAEMLGSSLQISVSRVDCAFKEVRDIAIP